MLQTINVNKVTRQLFAQEQINHEVEAQVSRYDQECGPVKVYRMSDMVMEQSPVAYASELKA